ncbi:hypothetical protein MMUC44124_29200 [Mycolicibacterium mucogenicum DSM 44124]|nr:hypothetical protein MMUC44124_29200 [Mycolicibacterium mucogenicum DSM 44124]
MLRAADIASHFGNREVTVCEFGVAQGAGLLNMVELASDITRETGIKFRIFGFDTGEGLSEISGYKDHPEIWSQGDYPMFNKAELTAKLKGRADLLIGDIHDTIGGFISEHLTPAAPLGFISIDVDIYTPTKHALRCLQGASDLYTPAVSVYLDDVSTFFSNRWCGELAAVDEFNVENQLRKIDVDRTLPGHRTDRNRIWFERMYVCHVLDHVARSKADPARRTKTTPGGHIPERVLL